MRKTAAVAVVSLFAFAAAAIAHENEKSEKLGRVQFKTSCTPQAQKEFERALAMLHSFWFPETVKAFSAIPQTDPACAIAYWGLAVATRPNPLVGPFDAATLKRGLDAVEKGEAIGAKTQRERDWLAAIKEFYKGYETVDQDTRTANYEKAMAALAEKYPNDVEAKIFHALALNEKFDHKDMKPLLQAIKILEPLDTKYPDHPGIAHYLIHSYDFAPIAKKGIPAANKYAKIASAALRDTRNADIQNYLGYAYRNTGELGSAFKHYQRALQLNARHRGAHEYVGEAYLMIGNVAKAEEHLALLRKICLIPCAETGVLEKKIDSLKR